MIKSIKKSLSLLLALALVLTLLPMSLPASAADQGTITINVSGELTSADVNSALSGVDDLNDTYSVIITGATSIGNDTFKDCYGLKSVTIPNSVISIGDRAFEECQNLAAVIIPDSVETIGDSAFNCCYSLADVIIGSSVTEIGDNAFDYCYIRHLYMYPQSAPTFGTGCFYRWGYATVHVTASAVGNYEAALSAYTSLTVVGDLSGATAASLIAINRDPRSMEVPLGGVDGILSASASLYPASSETLSYQWYSNTNDSNTGGTILSGATLKAYALPADLEAGAHYYYCVVSAPGAVSIATDVCEVYVYSDKGEIEIDGNGGTVTEAMVNAAFADHGVNKSLDTYTVTVTNATAIGNSAFYNCYDMTGVTLPDGLQSIGNSAFYSCNSLTGVTLPAGLKSIGTWAFAYSGITEITIPTSVESIGYYAFFYCNNLYKVNFKGDPPTLGTSAFAYCPANLTLYYPEGKSATTWASPDAEYANYRIRSDATKPGEDECLITAFEITGIDPANVRIDNTVNRITITCDYNDSTMMGLLSNAALGYTDSTGVIEGISGQDLTVDAYTLTVSNSGKECVYWVVLEQKYEEALSTTINLSGSNVPVSTNQLVITFGTAMDPDYGTVSIDPAGATLTNPVWSEDNTVLTYTLSGLLPGTTYVVEVEGFEAADGFGDEVEWVEVFIFTTGPDSGPVYYTVTYDANGGSGSYKAADLSFGEKYTVLTLDDTGISWDGYGFVGWATKPDGTGTDYRPGDTLEITDDVRLYAQWEKNGLDYENHFAYIIGYTDGKVRPDGEITRAETATIFFRLLTQERRAELWSKTNRYSDVESTDWYNNAISTLTNGGILTGYTDRSFRPDAKITRAEFAVIAARFTSGTYTGPDKFDDIGGHWAAEYINIAASLGWVEGDGDGNYRPDDYITRAEAATLVNRVLGRHVESDDDMLDGMTVWPDNTSDDWYYFDIQEATNSHYYERKPGGVYEKWTELRTVPNWSALEKADSKPGDVSY